jgi:uncharacterized protein (DUF427 family)
VIVRFNGVVIVDTVDAVRVLETSHPPAYYLPRAAFADGVLQSAPGRSACEYKGEAKYLDVVVNGQYANAAAWNYATPRPGFEELADRVSLYPALMDSCSVDGEIVVPQPGQFYGGWITSRVVGPFKGAPGSLGW